MKGELYVKMALAGGRGAVSECYCTPPLKIAKAFGREYGYEEVMVMALGPGIMKGDSHYIDFRLESGTKTIVSAQSHQKVLNTGLGMAKQSIVISVGEDASLCWMPGPVVPFKGSNFNSKAHVSLKRSSKLLYSETLACGRAKMGEAFQFSEYSSRLEVEVEGNLAFLDNARLAPGKADLSGIGFFEGYLCQGFLYIYGFSPISLPSEDGIEAALTKAREGYVARIFGGGGDMVLEYQKKLARLFIASDQ